VPTVGTNNLLVMSYQHKRLIANIQSKQSKMEQTYYVTTGAPIDYDQQDAYNFGIFTLIYPKFYSVSQFSVPCSTRFKTRMFHIYWASSYLVFNLSTVQPLALYPQMSSSGPPISLRSKSTNADHLVCILGSSEKSISLLKVFTNRSKPYGRQNVFRRGSSPFQKSLAVECQAGIQMSLVHMHALQKPFKFWSRTILWLSPTPLLPRIHCLYDNKPTHYGPY
jgi:hypothetical protein